MRIFYYTGGTERGQWREAFPNVWPEYKPAADLIEEIVRAGYTVRVEPK